MLQAVDEVEARAECEAKGFLLEQLPGILPVQLLREVKRLEDCSLQNLRDECAEHGFPAAGRWTGRGEHEELVQVLADLFIWNIWQRSDVASLRKLCLARGLAVTETERPRSLWGKLRDAAWQEQGIPLMSDLRKAQDVLDRIRVLRDESLEELQAECDERRVPFAQTMGKEKLVSLLRQEIVWRELASLTLLRDDCRRLGIHTDTKMKRAELEQRLVKSLRKDVLAAYMPMPLPAPLSRTSRQEGELYHYIKKLEVSVEEEEDGWLSCQGGSQLNFYNLALFTREDKIRLFATLDPYGYQIVAPASTYGYQPGNPYGHQTVIDAVAWGVWAARDLPVHKLHKIVAATLAMKLHRQQQASLFDLVSEYCQEHGLPEEYSLDATEYRTRLRWLALEDAFGRRSWADKCAHRKVALSRLQRGNLSAFRLVRRLDEFDLLNEEQVRQECKERRLLWPPTAEKGILVERLRREALLSELDWKELLWECESCGVPLEDPPYFWGLCWFSDEQESELRKWLVRWCLVCDSEHLWKDRGLPLLLPGERLEWYLELQNASDSELKDRYLGDGLPDDVDLKRQDMLEHFRQLRVWRALPLDELRRTCRDLGAPAQNTGDEFVIDEGEWLRTHLVHQIYHKKGIPAKYLPPQSAKMLNDYFCELGRMDQKELIEEHSRELRLPCPGLPPQEVVERLKKIRKWNILPKEALRAECNSQGVADALCGCVRTEEVVDVLKWHECRSDFRQMDIPVDRIPSFGDCVQLVKEWKATAALTEGQLEKKISELGLSKTGPVFTGSPRVRRELLKEKAVLEKVRLEDLQRLCREIKRRNQAMGLNTIASKHQKKELVKHLIQTVWSRNNFGDEVPAGRPSELELLSLLARFQEEQPLFNADFTEAMYAWSWWDLRLFLQSHGLIDPRLVAVKRREPVSGRVSVVTPTSEKRQEWHQQLWESFDSQTWDDKELVVVETWVDGPSPTFASLNDERLVYVSLKVEPEGEYLSLGTQRNWGMQLASGTYIANFDDDDFYAPRYLDTMLHAMGGKGAITLGSWYTYEANSGKFGYRDPQRYDADPEENLYGYGFSFVYGREVACRTGYPDEHITGGYEDLGFMNRLRADQLLGAEGVEFLEDNYGICLHVMHTDNTVGCPADEEVSPDEGCTLEVCELPSFYSHLRRIPQAPSDVESSIPDRLRVRPQKLLVKGFVRGSQCSWNIVVPAGSVARDVKQKLKAEHFDIEGWESARLSLGNKRPPVLMEDDERVPLRFAVLHVNFRCRRAER